MPDDISAGKLFAEISAKAGPSLLTDVQKAISPATALLEKQGRSLGGEIAKNHKAALLAVSATASAVALKSAATYASLGRDVIALQRQTGLTAEASSALAYQLKRGGIEAQSFSAFLRPLVKHLQDNDDVAKKLGITYRNAAGELLPFDVILGKVADKFAEMPDGLEKTALAQSLFGRQGAQMIPILNRGAAGLAAQAREAEKLGLILDTKSIGSVREYTKASKDFKDALDALQVAIGREVLPKLTQMKTRGAEALTWLVKQPGVGKTVAEISAAGVAVGALSTPLAALADAMEIGRGIMRRRTTETVAQTRANHSLAASELRVAAAARTSALAYRTGRTSTTTAPPRSASPGIVGTTGRVAGAGSFLSGTAGMLAAGAVGGLAAGELASQIIHAGGLSFLGAPSDQTIARRAGDDDAYSALDATRRRLQATEEGQARLRKYKLEIRDAVASGDTERLAQVTGKLDAALASVGDSATDAKTGLRVLSAARREAIAQTAAQLQAQFRGFSPIELIQEKDSAGAKSGLRSASTGAELAANRLTDAESRLEEVRRKRTSSANDIVRAEHAVRAATLANEDAQARLAKAQEKVNEAPKATATSVRDLLRGAQSRRDYFAQQLKDVTALRNAGLRKGVLDQLLEEDATNRGTLRGVAKGVTRGLVTQLNKFDVVTKTVSQRLASLLEDKEAFEEVARRNYAAYWAETERQLGVRARLSTVTTERGGDREGPLGGGAANANDLGPSARTTYDLRGSTFQVQDPADMARQLRDRERMGSLAGGPIR